LVKTLQHSQNNYKWSNHPNTISNKVNFEFGYDEIYEYLLNHYRYRLFKETIAARELKTQMIENSKLKASLRFIRFLTLKSNKNRYFMFKKIKK